MSDPSNRVFERIRRDNLRPISRRLFIVRNVLLWTSFAATIAVGSLAWSVVVFSFFHQEWDLYVRGGAVAFLRHYLLVSIPFLWIALFGAFSVFAHLVFRHVDRGYRYRTLLVCGASALSSIIIGSALSFTRVCERVEYASHDIPVVRRLIVPQEEIWGHPERGFLAGNISTLESGDRFVIIDHRGGIWEVTGSDIFWKHPARAEVGLPVKVFGSCCTGANGFTGIEVRAWHRHFPNTRMHR